MDYTLDKEKIKNIIIKNSNWSPSVWSKIHYYAWCYPDNPNEDDRFTAYIFYTKNIKSLIACPMCLKHYSEMIKDNAPNTHNRESLLKWTVDIHNMVNKRLGKPELDHRYLVIWYNMGCVELPNNREEFFSIFKKENKVYKEIKINKKKTYINIILIIIAIIVIFLINKRYSNR